MMATVAASKRSAAGAATSVGQVHTTAPRTGAGVTCDALRNVSATPRAGRESR